MAARRTLGGERTSLTGDKTQTELTSRLIIIVCVNSEAKKKERKERERKIYLSKHQVEPSP